MYVKYSTKYTKSKKQNVIKRNTAINSVVMKTECTINIRNFTSENS